MKLLLCHNFYQQWGGEDQVFLDEAALLRERGHEVVEYTRHNDEIKNRSRAAVARETFWSRRSYEEARALIRREQPDLVHCTNIFPLLSPAVYDAAEAEGVPVVQSLHNYRLLCPNAFFVYDGKTCDACLTKSLAWPGIVRKCYRDSLAGSAVLAGSMAWHRLRGTWKKKVHTYIALSEFSRRTFIRGGLPAERIVVKPNSVHPDPGSGTGSGGYAVFMSRLSPEKGLAIALDAWSRLEQPIPLKILGAGPQAALAAEAAVRNPHIEYLGKQDLARVLEIIGEAACLVLPSVNYEHCPKVILEANAKGTPVIASAIGAMAEMVAPGRSGLLVPPGDSAALAQTIGEAFAKPEMLAALRPSSRAWYETPYTAEQNYGRLLAINERVQGRDSSNLAAAEEYSAESAARDQLPV
jgi:glycosyltransferase involved in cell wall biosynthesis